MKEYKGLKIPTLKSEDKRQVLCDISDCEDSVGENCLECIFDFNNKEVFNEWLKEISS